MVKGLTLLLLKRLFCPAVPPRPRSCARVIFGRLHAALPETTPAPVLVAISPVCGSADGAVAPSAAAAALARQGQRMGSAADTRFGCRCRRPEGGDNGGELGTL